MSTDTIPSPLQRVRRSEGENKFNLYLVGAIVAAVVFAAWLGWGALTRESPSARMARESAEMAAAAPPVPVVVTEVVTVTEILTQTMPVFVDVAFPVTVTVSYPVTVTEIQSVYVPVTEQQFVTVTEIVQIPAPLPVAPAGAVLVCIYGEGLTGIYLGPASPDVQPLGVTGGSCTPVVWGGPVGDYRLTFTR